MPYKVFFVEDEVVTREGIRDNVDWKASGFEFCGEASDGEMALPLLYAVQPDVIITDIKMPFMDGLQLSKVIRERMSWVKIIILSGHDEFEYAQQAIKLGVTDYLLKPVTVQKLQSTLQNLAVRLEQERKEQENLKKLQEQVEENKAALRERLLFNLVVGTVSSTEAIERGQMLGLDLVARHYLVVVLKIELGDRSEQYDYDEFQRTQRVVMGVVEGNPDVFLLKRDWGDLILLMKGVTPEYLEEECDLLLSEVRRAVAETHYRVVPPLGRPKNGLRISASPSLRLWRTSKIRAVRRCPYRGILSSGQACQRWINRLWKIICAAGQRTGSMNSSRRTFVCWVMRR
jgi:two-component system response regulator YesN